MHLYNKRKSVANEIIRQSTLIVLVGFLIVLTVGYFQVKQAIIGQLKSDMDRMSSIAKQSLVQPIWHFDQISIDSICNSFFTKTNDSSFQVVKIVLRDASDVVVFERSMVDNLQIAESKDVINESEDILVIRDGETIGKLQIWIDTSLVKKSYLQSLAIVFGVMLFLVLFLIAANIVMIRHLVVKPFEKLLNLANEAFKGNYIRNTDEDKQTEFGVLARAFNRTFLAINERDQKIKVYTEALEKLVEEKSKELDAERMKTLQSTKLTMLGEFAGQIAHEINNPLAVIQGLGQVIVATIKPDQPEIKTYSEKIVKMTERIAKIIRGVKLFTRDGAGDPIVPFSAEEFISSAQDMISHKVQKAKIKLTVKNELNGTGILGREVQVTQVLVNLISNACDAIQDKDEKWIELWLRNQNGKTYISVTDSGLGIPMEIRDKLLQPFFTTKPVGQGTGLGLSISRQIAQQHQGELIYDDSCPNTRFTIIIPAVNSNREAA